jgi:adhesin/invasin
MKIRHRLSRGASLGAFLLSFSGAIFAAQLKENSADIQQVVNIPGMAIAINPGGTGCNAVRHEKWEPTQNGCSNIEWVKNTARVVSVTASPPSILANNSDASTLTATVVDGDGYLVGFGIPTSWGTSNGWLSSTSTTTDASGKSAVALRGTVAAWATVTAGAVAGAASANVLLVPDASTSRVVSLTPSPSSVPADGTAAALYATVRDAYNNILPAGQPVYWAATLGSLNSGLSYTDGNGVAVATIASGSPGDSTIYARTAVSSNATTGVTFISVAPPALPAPVITTITASEGSYGEDAMSGAPARIFWGGANMSGATSYTITVRDSMGWGFQGPSTYSPTVGSTSWWLTSKTPNQADGKPGQVNTWDSGDGIATLTACNGSSCTSATVKVTYKISATGG